MKQSFHHRLQHGFSLLELSIALAVIGIVVAGGLTMSTSMVDRQAYVQTGNQMNEVDKAVAAFVAVNTRLPCPADPALAIDHADFGREQAACAGTTTAVGTGAKNVRIGALPVRTLGLRDRMGADEYGNRYTYAVTEPLTTSAATGGYNDATETGAITLADTGIDDAAYVVVSHGGDSKGAYRYETASSSVACVGGQDAENCNNDATFRDTRFNRGSVAANWFDDSVRFARKEIINLNAGGASTGGTQYWEATGNHIYNTNSENVGIGIANPTGGKLDVLAPINVTALHLQTADGPGIGLSVETDGGNGAVIETWNAQHALLVNSRLNENGISILTNGNNARSLWIDHVGGSGTGLGLTMNNNGTGIDLNMLQGGTGASIVIANGSGVGLNIYSESGADGIYADVWGSDGNQYAVSGFTNGGTGSTFDASAGLRGVVRNSPGWGVYGLHAVNSGEGMGVYGVTESTAGYGVYGRAVANTGMNYGGYFTTASPVLGAYGVYGANIGGGTNQTAGVYGTSNSQNGYGVQGWASSATGGAMGVYGLSQSQTGRGVYGWASHNTGANAGVWGQSTSTSGRGVYGWATAASGSAHGVYGVSDSSVGYGVYGEANSSNTVQNKAGVYGTSIHGRGVVGESTNYIGIQGSSSGSAGIMGSTSAVTGSGVLAGVFGWATGATGNTYGVYGSSSSSAGYGVWCQSSFRCGGNQAWTNTSDMRLKENIVLLNDAHGLDAIRKLRPVTYEWKDVTQKKANGTQVGFIAQEVEKVIPEVVVNGTDQTIDFGNGKKEVVVKAKSIGYAELTAPLVRAVQQLADKFDALFDSVKSLIVKVSGHDADIAALKADNATLKADNDALKTRLDALETKLAK